MARVPNDGHGEVESNEALWIDGRAELLERNARSPGAGGRANRCRPWNVREIDSSAYAGSRTRRPVRSPRGSPPAAGSRCRGRLESAVSVSEGERPPRPADTGVDDREVDADGHEADRVREDESAWRTDVAGIPCVMSMICVSGAIRSMTPWHVPTKSSFNPKSLRNVMNTPRSVTPPGVRSYLRLGRRGAQRRAVLRRASPHRRTPRGLILTKAVGARSGRGLATTVAAYASARGSRVGASTWRGRARRALRSRAAGAPVSRR